jgi:hypothetical protein
MGEGRRGKLHEVAGNAHDCNQPHQPTSEISSYS